MKKQTFGALVNQHGEGYGVGHIPRRKRVALYRRARPNVFVPIAYFRDEAEAMAFWEYLLQSTGADKSRGQGFAAKGRKKKP